jgi:carbamoyltransferase
MAQSLGNIYAMITFLMGMVPLEHEYKLMGLAPYADPKGAERVSEMLSALIRFDPRAPLGWEKVESCPETYCSYRFFRDLLERQRFDWVAGGLQRFTENIVVRWVRNCIRETGVRKVALSGGLFMNVKANKLIMELPEVEDLFVYPSCGDESNSMGAAYWVFAQHGQHESMRPLRDVYFGRQFTDDEIEEALRTHKFQGKVQFERVPDIAASVAHLLAGGEVVARHAGREEFGARALGNRSVLANASRAGVIRIINEAIKSRDFWMPFATSVMAERESDYIINPKRVRAPYMILSFDTTDRRSEIMAGIHPYDYTVRPQVVDECWNPGYHRVISEFSALTGIGAVLNTSLNLHGFPITSSPADSLDVLDRSGLQNLALENWLVRKA